jgi:hypothetical protein
MSYEVLEENADFALNPGSGQTLGAGSPHTAHKTRK